MIRELPWEHLWDYETTALRAESIDEWPIGTRLGRCVQRKSGTKGVGVVQNWDNEFVVCDIFSVVDEKIVRSLPERLD